MVFQEFGQSKRKRCGVPSSPGWPVPPRISPSCQPP
jgi:hypothetical protein